MSIQVWGYLKEYEQYREEILAAVDKVFSSGRLILGQSVKDFEASFAAYCGTACGVGHSHPGRAATGRSDDIPNKMRPSCPPIRPVCRHGYDK
jgi:hypothetical protein